MEEKNKKHTPVGLLIGGVIFVVLLVIECISPFKTGFWGTFFGFYMFFYVAWVVTLIIMGATVKSSEEDISGIEWPSAIIAVFLTTSAISFVLCK